MTSHKVGTLNMRRTIFDYYYVLDGIAYNVDNIPVRKLFITTTCLLVCIISLLLACSALKIFLYTQLNSKYVESNFLEYATIESIEFDTIRKVDGTHYRRGFVTFTEATAIDKIMRDYWKFAVAFLRLQIADSWLQPDYKELFDTPIDAEDYFYKPPGYNYSFVQMGVNSIEMVLQHCELAPAIKMALSHPEIRKVFVRLYSKQFKFLHFDVVEDLTHLEFRCLLQMVGESVEHLRGELPASRSLTIVELITMYCPNLTSFQITAARYRSSFRSDILPMLRVVMPRRNQGRIIAAIREVVVNAFGVHSLVHSYRILE